MFGITESSSPFHSINQNKGHEESKEQGRPSKRQRVEVLALLSLAKPPTTSLPAIESSSSSSSQIDLTHSPRSPSPSSVIPSSSSAAASASQSPASLPDEDDIVDIVSVTPKAKKIDLSEAIYKGLLLCQKNDFEGAKACVERAEKTAVSGDLFEAAQIHFLKGLIRVMELQLNPKEIEIKNELKEIKNVFKDVLKNIKIFKRVYFEETYPIIGILGKGAKLAKEYINILSLQFRQTEPRFLDIIEGLIPVHKKGQSPSPSSSSSSSCSSSSAASSLSSSSSSSSSTKPISKHHQITSNKATQNTANKKKRNDNVMLRFRTNYRNTIKMLNKGEYSKALENNKLFYATLSLKRKEGKAIALGDITPYLLQAGALFGIARQNPNESENSLIQAKAICIKIEDLKQKKIHKTIQKIEYMNAINYILKLPEQPLTEPLNFSTFTCFEK